MAPFKGLHPFYVLILVPRSPEEGVFRHKKKVSSMLLATCFLCLFVNLLHVGFRWKIFFLDFLYIKLINAFPLYIYIASLQLPIFCSCSLLLPIYNLYCLSPCNCPFFFFFFFFIKLFAQYQITRHRHTCPYIG